MGGVLIVDAGYQLKAIFILIIFLTLGNLALGWHIEGSVSPHKGDRERDITITYSINKPIKNPRVKVYLSNYIPETNSFNTSTSHILINYFNVDPDNISPIHLKLTDEPSNFYRICLGMRCDGCSSTYTDCDKDNQFLLIDDTPIQETVVKVEPSDLHVFVSAPQKVFAGERFFVNATLANDGGDKEIRLYSYVRNGSKKVSEGSWTGNAIFVQLAGRSSSTFTLSNVVNKVGKFLLTVRANYGKKISVVREINVVRRPLEEIGLSTLLVNKTLRILVSNPDYYEHNATFVLFTPDNVTVKKISILPKHSYESFFNLPEGRSSLLLFNRTSLVSSNSFLINASPVKPVVITHEPVEVMNSSPENQQQPKVKVETLLYPLIVFVSLSSLAVVLKK